MATWSVQEDGGGDFTTLASALANASVGAGDTVNIEGLWDNADTTVATVSDASLTIQCLGSSLHDGFVSDAAKHYRLRTATGGSHSLTINAATCTVIGLVIHQNSTGGSDEAIRISNASTHLIENCILYGQSTRVDNADGIYWGNLNTFTVTVRQCVIYNFSRGGIHWQNFSDTASAGTLNVNSCSIWNCGRSGESDTVTRGGICIRADHTGLSTKTINVHNTICLGNTADGGNDFEEGASSPPAGIPGIVWNISYSIDSDNSIAGLINSGTGNLASRTPRDATAGGNEVLFEDITSFPFDLRLLDDATNNDAQDMHADATEHGLTIPSVDFIGTSRPQNTNYDCGAFEVAVGSEEYTATSSLSSGGFTSSSNASFESPEYTATTSLVIAPVQSVSIASFQSPIYEADSVLTSAPFVSAGTATFSPGTDTATSALVVGTFVSAGTATFQSPIYEADSVLTSAPFVSNGTATFQSPVYEATSELFGGSGDVAATAIFAEGLFQASSVLTVSGFTSSSTATFSPGTDTAIAVLLSAPYSVSSTATFESPIYEATASLSAGSGDASSTATFEQPVYEAIVSLSGGSGDVSSTATFEQPEFTATSELFGGSGDVVSTAEVADPQAGDAVAFLTSGVFSSSLSATFEQPVYEAIVSLSGGSGDVTATAIFATDINRTAVATLSTDGFLVSSVASNIIGESPRTRITLIGRVPAPASLSGKQTGTVSLIGTLPSGIVIDGSV